MSAMMDTIGMITSISLKNGLVTIDIQPDGSGAGVCTYKVTDREVAQAAVESLFNERRVRIRWEPDVGWLTAWKITEE